MCDRRRSFDSDQFFIGSIKLCYDRIIPMIIVDAKSEINIFGKNHPYPRINCRDLVISAGFFNELNFFETNQNESLECEKPHMYVYNIKRLPRPGGRGCSPW